MVEISEEGGKQAIKIKLTDFGFATVIEPGQTLSLSLGSPLYMDPNIAFKQPYNQKVDVWAIGVLTFMLLSGARPFPGKGKEQIFQLIAKGSPNYDLLTKYHKEGREVIDFISQCLNKNYDHRPTISQLFASKWMRRYSHLNQGMSENQQIENFLTDEKVDVGLHLYKFKEATNFQSGVTSLLVNLKLGEDEFNKLRRVFVLLDTDRDGQLSLQELEEQMGQVEKVFLNVLGRIPNWKALVSSIDSDENGRVNYEEFLTAASNKAKLFSDKNLRIAFDILDKNGNGFICKDDLKETFT